MFENTKEHEKKASIPWKERGIYTREAEMGMYMEPIRSGAP
jgi:hypothetical protein